MSGWLEPISKIPPARVLGCLADPVRRGEEVASGDALPKPQQNRAAKQPKPLGIWSISRESASLLLGVPPSTPSSSLLVSQEIG